jgi:hypothetical protein
VRVARLPKVVSVSDGVVEVFFFLSANNFSSLHYALYSPMLMRLCDYCRNG